MRIPQIFRYVAVLSGLAALSQGVVACLSVENGDSEFAGMQDDLDEGEPLTAEDLPLGGLSLGELAFDDSLPSVDAPWQKALSAGLDDVEHKTERFVESASTLYDALLKIETESDLLHHAAFIEQSARTSLAQYRTLLVALVRLEADLNRPDIRSSLPLSGREAQANFRDVQAMLSRLAGSLKAKRPLSYKASNQHSLMQFIFADQAESEIQPLADLPKAQREALLLLDRLRGLSSDVAFVSMTVTAWIYAGSSTVHTAH